MKLNHRDTEAQRKLENQFSPRMNTDEHRSENRMVLIRVYPCSSVANSSFAFLCVSVSLWLILYLDHRSHFRKRKLNPRQRLQRALEVGSRSHAHNLAQQLGSDLGLFLIAQT